MSPIRQASTQQTSRGAGGCDSRHTLRLERKTVAAEADLLLNRAIGEEDELDRLGAEAKNARYSRSWLFLAPLLLAAAVALRLTRVTAEVFVLRKSKVPSGSVESQAQV
jgi:hypothetical protein